MDLKPLSLVRKCLILGLCAIYFCGVSFLYISTFFFRVKKEEANRIVIISNSHISNKNYLSNKLRSCTHALALPNYSVFFVMQHFVMFGIFI